LLHRPRGHNGLSQVNVFLPQGVRTGLLPVRVEWHRPSAFVPDHYVRVIPPALPFRASPRSVMR